MGITNSHRDKFLNPIGVSVCKRVTPQSFVSVSELDLLSTLEVPFVDCFSTLDKKLSTLKTSFYNNKIDFFFSLQSGMD